MDKCSSKYDNNGLIFLDKLEHKLEYSLEEIFINLRKDANEAKILEIIKNREEKNF